MVMEYVNTYIYIYSKHQIRKTNYIYIHGIYNWYQIAIAEITLIYIHSGVFSAIF